MKFKIINDVIPGSCMLYYLVECNGEHTKYICYGNSFKEAIKYFNIHFKKSYHKYGIIYISYFSPEVMKQMSMAC